MGHRRPGVQYENGNGWFAVICVKAERRKGRRSEKNLEGELGMRFTTLKNEPSMDNKNLQIKALTMALRNTDGLCEWCVGCHALGLNHSDNFAENDCLQSENRGYDFVFDTERIAEDFGLIEDFPKKVKETNDFLLSKRLI